MFVPEIDAQLVANLTGFMLSLLGGGTIGAVISVVTSNQRENRRVKIAHLEKQLTHLYGPLYLYTSQSAQLFKLAKDQNNARDIVFPNNEAPSDLRMQQIGQSIEAENAYMRLAKANNIKIQDIINANYALMDSEDIGVFNGFFRDNMRLTIEWTEETNLKVPLAIYQHIGPPHLLDSTMVAWVEARFHTKQRLLRRLQTVDKIGS